MLRVRHFKVIGVLFGLTSPLAVMAAFVGPSQAPPAGNVPGVVWNRTSSGGGVNQQNATDFNIGGSGRLAGDLILGNTKALRIDYAGAATFNIGNWGDGPQPLTISVFGDIETNSVGATEGRVTAPKFCLGPSCITSWPSGTGGGIIGIAAGKGIIITSPNGPTTTVAFDEPYGDARYVKTFGNDTKSGQLDATVASGYALIGNSGNVDGDGGLLGTGANGVFGRGTNYGVVGETPNANGAAVLGTSPNGYGGLFSGGSDGVRASGRTNGGYFDGGSFGVNAYGDTSGAFFQNNLNTGYYAYLAYNGYGGYFGAPRGQNSIYATESVYVGGNLSAPNNIPSSCATETVTSGALTYQCGNGRFMTGIRKNASNIVDGVVCCEL